MLDRLDDSVRLLVGGSRVAPTRQQTLRAAFDWSDALLTETERALFYRLAVFAGAFTLEAVEAVCADADRPSADAFETLTRLVDKSLVTVTHGDGWAWYRLLEPLRQYAMQHLVTRGERAAVQARHARFSIALAAQSARALRGPEQAAWLVRLDHEQGNLRAALRWVAERGEHETGLRFATALVPFWEARGHLAEGRHWLETAFASGTERVAPPVRLRARLGAGRLTYLQGAYTEAEARQRESLALAQAVGDQHGIAAALTEVGMVARLQRDLAHSTACLTEGLARFRALEDADGIAFALLNLGATARVQGALSRSSALLEESLTRYQSLGDRRSIAIAQANLGLVALQQGERERASDLLVAALTGHVHLGDRWFATFDLMGVAAILIARQQPEPAVRLLADAQTLSEALGSPVGAVTYGQLMQSARMLLREDRFAVVWAEGQAFNLDQAVATARRSVTESAPSTVERASAPVATPLTRREYEVARLLGLGETDRQIAETLSISVKTVGVHVHHILQKLDLYSRVQVADWLHAQPPD